jgi:hypothetical protein
MYSDIADTCFDAIYAMFRELETKKEELATI